MSDQDPNFEQQLRLHDYKVRNFERAYQQHQTFLVEVNRALVESGNLALRMVILINGGAAVAVLAFIGGMASQGKLSIEQMRELTSNLIWFTSGVAVGGLALGFVYFTTFAVMMTAHNYEARSEHPFYLETAASKRWWFAGEGLRAAAVLLGLGSLLLFIAGALDLRDAVRLLK
jgi:hypothetical protein